MSEVTFAKAFLVTLDKKPIKLPADHVSDPRKYPNQSPYILPKQTHPFPRKDPSSLVGSKSETITVTIKAMKGGETVTLSGTSLDDTIHDVKSRYAQKIGLSLDKIKLLLNKKPAADLKTLSELNVDKDIEITAMLMGGATAEVSPAAAAAGVAPNTEEKAVEDKMEIDSAPGSEQAQVEAEAAAGSGAQEALKTDEFWSDLEGFLAQRLRDQEEASKLAKLFKQAWTTS